MVLNTGVPVARLLPGITGRLGLPSPPDYVLYAATGHAIPGNATLTHAGVADGEFLTVGQALGAPARPSGGYPVLPTYVVIDTSASMDGRPIGDVNAELPQLHRRMVRDPLLAEVAHLAIVTFDDVARVHTPLTDITASGEPRPLAAEGRATNFEDVFRLLRQTIADDLYALARDGRRPYRPAVFFLSDGQPNRGPYWKQALDDLTDRRAFHGAPNMIAFGFGGAVEPVIRAVGLQAAYIATILDTPTSLLGSFMAFLLSSLQMSVSRGAGGGDRNDILEIPKTPPAGWRALHAHT